MILERSTYKRRVKGIHDRNNEIEKSFPHRESNPDRQGESLLS